MNYRGYITSNMLERSVPQHIQQQVIRDYCARNELNFLLSATEYLMDGSTLILDAIQEIGIVMYSIFCMPKNKEARQRLYDSDKDVRFAAENIKMDRNLIEIVFGVYNARSSICDTAAYLKSTKLS